MPTKTGSSVLFAVLISVMLMVGICFNASETIVCAQDNVPPTTSHDYNGAWYTSDFTINLTVTDSSGISDTYYRINGEEIETISRDGQPRITTENSNNTLEYWSIDKAGNQEPSKTLTDIKLDKTVPTGSMTINYGAISTTSNQVTITISANDSTSGVVSMRFFEVVYGNWEEYATSKFWTLNTTGEGYKTVYVQVKDKAGLVSAARNATIWLGSNPPGPWMGVDPPLTHDTEKPSATSPIIPYATTTITPSATIPVSSPGSDMPKETSHPDINTKAFPLWLSIIAAITIGIIIATAAAATAFLWSKRK
jgi:hypothetical protein